jgi:hypothetical protein
VSKINAEKISLYKPLIHFVLFFSLIKGPNKTKPLGPGKIAKISKIVKKIDKCQRKKCALIVKNPDRLISLHEIEKV